jgi:hypothetical protein
MENINEYFPPEEEDGWLEHPRLRHWQELQQGGAQLQVEVRREPHGLDVSSPVLHVTIATGGQKQIENEMWSDELHRGLVKLGVKAVSDDNESLRFGIAFADAFEPAEERVGDGFFNSVLIDALKQGPLARRLEDKLRHIHVLTPSRDGRSYADCKDLIVGAIQGRARELTRDLRYEKPRANQILGGALAIYLDDRFSITERRQLGWA